METRRALLAKEFGTTVDEFERYNNNDIDLSSLDPSKPTMVFADDYCSIGNLFNILVDKLNLKDFFNVVTVCGTDACLKIMDSLFYQENFTIDVAILDITFNNTIRYQNANRCLNGIDLVDILLTINPETVYHFLTGHNVTRESRIDFYKQIMELGRQPEEVLSFKERPITTNIDLIVDVLKGTKYDGIAKIIMEKD